MIALLLTAAASNVSPVPADVAMPGCDEVLRARFDPGPLESGPLRLVSIACLPFTGSSFGVSDAIVAPDGTAVAAWQYGPSPVEIVSPGQPSRIAVTNRVTFRNFAGIMGDASGSAPDSLAWSRDSQSLFTVRQHIGSPAGWAFGGLEPVTLMRDGGFRPLPPLRHPAGPLDAIFWVGGEGRALAIFGSMGDYYRPEHEDPAPTLAIVDSAHGRVLDTLAASALPRLRERTRAWGLRPAGATAVRLPDGRMRAVIQFSRWFDNRTRLAQGQEPIMHPGFWLLWTQGQSPVERLRPDEDRALPFALSPNGRFVLAVRALQPNGIQIFDCRGCPPPPAPTPVTAAVAELIDVASGRVVWQVQARSTSFWPQRMAPAISPDGRYALIDLPSDERRRWLALIDMRNGRIVQRLAPFQVGSYRSGASFAPDGRSLRITGGNFLLTYALPRDR